MELKELFKLQSKLDARIIRKKGLEGQDLLPQKILALQVELGELANEWRGFKFWSNNQEPNEEIECKGCSDEGVYSKDECLYCGATGVERRPLLEEYVDCLHFILSIGLDLDANRFLYDRYETTIFCKDITKQFNRVFNYVTYLENNLFHGTERTLYLHLVESFLALGQLLGFTEEIIVQAYKDKNKVNHARQENGY